MLGEQSNKKNCFFFNIVRKGGGGGLVDSKISLTEKTEIFLDFSAERGGVSPNPKGFYFLLGQLCTVAMNLFQNCDRKQMRGLLASETILLTREGADAKRLPLLSPLLVKHWSFSRPASQLAAGPKIDFVAE